MHWPKLDLPHGLAKVGYNPSDGTTTNLLRFRGVGTVPLFVCFFFVAHPSRLSYASLSACHSFRKFWTHTCLGGLKLINTQLQDKIRLHSSVVRVSLSFLHCQRILGTLMSGQICSHPSCQQRIVQLDCVLCQTLQHNLHLAPIEVGRRGCSQSNARIPCCILHHFVHPLFPVFQLRIHFGSFVVRRCLTFQNVRQPSLFLCLCESVQRIDLTECQEQHGRRRLQKNTV